MGRMGWVLRDDTSSSSAQTKCSQPSQKHRHCWAFLTAVSIFSSYLNSPDILEET